MVAESVTFIRVPLDCPITPGLACGSEAKPFLQRLDKRREIARTWLNRSGTIVAIEWESKAPQRTRDATISAMTGNRVQGFEAKVLNARERSRVEESFRTRAEWYQAAEMDQLTAEEARAIAERLVWRMTVLSDLSPEKRSMLRSTIARIVAERLNATGNDAARRGMRGLEIRILKTAEPMLTADEVDALDFALAGGLGPAPYEPLKF